MTHPEMVAKLIKSDQQIHEEITDSDCGLIHSVLGIAGEAGEMVDAIKKCVIYQKPLDRENLVEELGDMEFYLEDLRQRIGVSRDECIAHNMAKLAIRYKNYEYSDHKAQTRADKV